MEPVVHLPEDIADAVQDLMDEAEELDIKISTDDEARTLTIADNDPNSQGDNPRGNWTVWPTTWENYVNAQSGAEVIFRQLDTENDMPAACDY